MNRASLKATKCQIITQSSLKQTNKQMENKMASASPLILVRWGFPGSISGPIAVKGCKRPWVSWRSFAECCGTAYNVLPNLLDASHITCPPGRSPIRSVCGIKWRRHPRFDWTNHPTVTFTAGKSDFLTTGAAGLVTASSLLVLKRHDLSSPTFSWGRIAHQNLWTQHQWKKTSKKFAKRFLRLLMSTHVTLPSHLPFICSPRSAVLRRSYAACSLLPIKSYNGHTWDVTSYLTWT